MVVARMIATQPSAVRGHSRASARSRPICSSTLQTRAQIAAATIAVTAGLTVMPALASVEFANIADGAKVESPVHVEFKVEGMTVRPAAEGLAEGTGHFHVLIDEQAPDVGEAIPFDDAHKHYGKGQLADDIALAPGTHSLVLQFANAQHLSYGPLFAQQITVEVK